MKATALLTHTHARPDAVRIVGYAVDIGKAAVANYFMLQMLAFAAFMTSLCVHRVGDEVKDSKKI